MNYSALQDLVLSRGFSSGQRSEVKEWLNYAAGLLWALEPWAFKFAEDDVTVTTSSTAVSDLASDVLIPMQLWNSDGERLAYLTPEAWNGLHYGQTDTGLPETWTVFHTATPPPTIRVGPISSETASDYRLYYERAYGHYEGSTFVAGPMSDSTDSPVFPEETQMVLVFWAREIGKGLRSDPTASLESQLKDEGIAVMRRSFLVPQRGNSGQWGAYEPEYEAGYWR